MIVVSDTSPLSGLAVVNQLGLVHALYGQLVIPSAVAKELEQGGQSDLRIVRVLSLNWVEIRSVTDRRLVDELEAIYKLDKGESEAIALAVELKAKALLIDERLGRREASRLGLSITGMLGILLAAKKQNLVSAIRPIVDELISKAGFRISDQLYQEVMAVAGEDSR